MSTPDVDKSQQAHDGDLRALAAAFEEFNRTTRKMEESYRGLEARFHALDRELAEKNRELSLATDYLRSLLESISDGVIAVDTEERITTFNRAAGQVLGFEAGFVIGKRFREVFGREFGVPRGRHVMELATRDGRRVTVSERDSPVRDREGKHIGTVKVFQDLTELRELRQRARRKDRLTAIGEMAATIAHEIRNPLGGIRGFAALLARDVKQDENASRLVDKILVGANDLDRVVGELLEYTRPMDLRLRPARCSDLVDAALGYLDFGGKEVILEVSVEPELEVMVDPDRIRQVFLNILLNAVQSIGQEGTVRIDAVEEAGVVVFNFEDTGCGMTAEQLKRFLMPFYTTKEKGTGLGMAVAAKIIESHGGSLDAESEPQSGTRIRVTLPGAG